jgi:DNA-directed primase/polymerase protein
VKKNVGSESALIERKRKKRKLENNGIPAESPNQGSIGREEKTPLSRIKTTNVESSIEKVSNVVSYFC